MVAPAKTVLPLESGDRLSRKEFHRRYCAHPEIHKAELIMGVVYVSSPARARVHGLPHMLIAAWAGDYMRETPGVIGVNEATIFLTDDGEVQPDVALFRYPPPPGRAFVTDDDYIEGTPPLVIEVAASSANYDLHDKKELYRRAGVHEYIVWRTLDQAIDWFRLVDGAYVHVEPDERGGVESDQFPGLRLEIPAMLERAASKGRSRPVTARGEVADAKQA